MRLLDGVANRCIRLSRRDPRQIPETEQALYDQLVTVLDGSSADRTVEFNLRTSQWAQHLAFQTSELIAVCIPLVDEVAARMKQCLRMLPTHAQVQVILLTAAAAALPGLRATLESRFRGDPTLQSQEDTKDFGEGLMLEGWMLAGEVQVLDADAVAAGAHDLACAFKRGELVAGHLDGVRLIRPSQAPPLEPSLPDDGPARLQFRGQEHPLVGETFTLGRDPNCSLVFEAEHYPQVASCHCDIVLDRRSYMLRDRSRLGTLVNERPVQRSVALHSGDWIRLGPDGPVLRFLGQATSLRPYRETE
jgi:hypothetical protein